jgi:hypothetical protein
MSKKGLFIVTGAILLGGAAVWYFWPSTAGKSASSSSSSTSSTDTSTTDASISDVGASDAGLGDMGTAGLGLDKTKKEVRKDCRLAARVECGTGLKHLKCRRLSRAKCKLAGGYDNGGADFAFNGHAW